MNNFAETVEKYEEFVEQSKKNNTMFNGENIMSYLLLLACYSNCLVSRNRRPSVRCAG